MKDPGSPPIIDLTRSIIDSSVSTDDYSDLNVISLSEFLPIQDLKNNVDAYEFFHPQQYITLHISKNNLLIQRDEVPNI